jgi:hypothetical protein
MLCHQPAERDAGDMRTRDARAGQNGPELLGEVLDAVGRGGHRRLVMAGKVIAQQREIPVEPDAGNVPQAMIDAEAMQHHQRRAGAASVQRDRAGIEDACAHVRSSQRPALIARQGLRPRLAKTRLSKDNQRRRWLPRPYTRCAAMCVARFRCSVGSPLRKLAAVRGSEAALRRPSLAPSRNRCAARASRPSPHRRGRAPRVR